MPPYRNVRLDEGLNVLLDRQKGAQVCLQDMLF